MAITADLSLFSRVSRHVRGEVRQNVPLAPWTSVRVGGPAEVYVRPASIEDLLRLLEILRDEGAPLAILGGGANTLVGDGGVPGVTLRLPAELFAEAVELKGGEGRVTLCAGASIVRIVNQMKANRLTGVEFLAGIPGTIGGAVAMNAGTKFGECLSAIEAIEVATPAGVGWLDRSQLVYRYRHTELPPDGVVTRARFLLREGDLAKSQAQMDADLSYRKRTQPLSQPNFGSVFQNPPGDHAGRLIEAVELKGHQLGQAQISTLHANWIVNLGGATARDVVGLISLAQQRVRETFGVELTPEVKRVGRFE